MNQKLQQLREEFSLYRGEKKKVSYPKDLWDRAIAMCQVYSVQKVSKALKISERSLQRYLSLKKEKNESELTFTPIRIIQPKPSLLIHVKGTVSMTIEFSQPIEDLAKLIHTLQGESRC